MTYDIYDQIDSYITTSMYNNRVNQMLIRSGTVDLENQTGRGKIFCERTEIS